jgi:hypothetical protein
LLDPGERFLDLGDRAAEGVAGNDGDARLAQQPLGELL